MPRRQETIEIHRDAEVVFDLVHDYARRLDWDPFLREACILGEATAAAKGVVTRCTAKNGLAMETVYVSFDRPRCAAVRMTAGPAIFASFAATWRQESAQPGVTRVVYEFHLTSRPRWLKWIIDPLLCRVFSWETRRRLAALKRALENGMTVKCGTTETH
jgi:ribosome-associated toxin RatA of RatAB toxin-antitoxin module